MLQLRPPARVFVYAKGVECNEIPEDVLAQVTCVEAINAGGREAHTLLLHISEHYDALPRFIVSLQDDNVNDNDQGQWMRKINKWIDDGPTAWEMSREKPHTSEGCLCAIVEEKPLIESTLHQLGQWLAERYFGWSREEHYLKGEPHLWPTGAEFLIPREKALRHPRSAYQGVLDSGLLLSIDHFTKNGANCSPEVLAALGGLPCEPSNGWAHALEKVWWLIL